MANLKNSKADLRATNKKVKLISICLSLSLLIMVFKYFPDIDPGGLELVEAQELFTVEDIQQTKQENRPPPPPKPPIPIEAPSDDVLEDIEIEDTEIDFDAEIEAPPPPVEEKATEQEPAYFVAVEEMPSPIGGIKAIQEKIVYPEIAKRAGVEGKVYILAFVNEQGKVTKAEIVKGIGAGCDEAAQNAILKTKFNPGKQRGKPVKVKVTIPVIFKLK
jgi:protein TonB